MNKATKNNNLTYLDLPETTITHAEILKKKPLLKKIYTQWYQQFINELQSHFPDYKDNHSYFFLEIGSGGGFLKELFPQIKTSDILPLPFVDYVFSAEKFPMKDASIDAIFMLNVLHHIPNAENFFSEAQRCLKPGGFIFMIEPANTPFARFIYKNFHHENFDTKQINWHFTSKGPLSSANGALPWIIFRRDYEKFKKLYPDLQLIKYQYHTPFAYLLSGGFSAQSMLPGFMFPVISFFEKISSPLHNFLGMFVSLKIVKK